MTGTCRLLDDLLDQAERMLGALAEADERDVRSLPRRDRPHVLDVDLTGDHLVPEAGDDRRDEGQPIRPFVRDQNAQMLGLPIAHFRSYGLSLRRCYSSNTAQLGSVVARWYGRWVSPQHSAGSLFRLRHSAGVASTPTGSTPDRNRKEPPCPLPPVRRPHRTSPAVRAGNHVQLAPGVVRRFATRSWSWSSPSSPSGSTRSSGGTTPTASWPTTVVHAGRRSSGTTRRCRRSRSFPGALIVVPAIWTFVTTFKRIQAAQRLNGQLPDQRLARPRHRDRDLSRARRLHAERAQLRLEGGYASRHRRPPETRDDDRANQRQAPAEPGRGSTVTQPRRSHRGNDRRDCGRRDHRCKRLRLAIPRVLAPHGHRNLLLGGPRVRRPAGCPDQRAPPHETGRRGSRDAPRVAALTGEPRCSPCRSRSARSAS